MEISMINPLFWGGLITFVVSLYLAYDSRWRQLRGIGRHLQADLSLFWYAASGAERYFEFRERALEADLKKYEEAESRNEGVVAIYDFSQFIPQQLEQALIHAEKAQALIDKLFYDKSAFMYRLVRRFHVPQSERDFLTQM